MSEEIRIKGKKITKLTDMFFEYFDLQRENECLKRENKKLKEYENLLINRNDFAERAEKLE